jgi:hypothetical protein
MPSIALKLDISDPDTAEITQLYREAYTCIVACDAEL